MENNTSDFLIILTLGQALHGEGTPPRQPDVQTRLHPGIPDRRVYDFARGNLRSGIFFN